MGLIARESWSTLFHVYNIFAGQVWIFIPLWVLVGPYVFFRSAAASMQTRTRIDQALRPPSHAGRDVGGQRVHGKDLRQVVHGPDAAGIVIDAGVMDHDIERSQLIHLVRNGLGFRDTGKIAHN